MSGTLHARVWQGEIGEIAELRAEQYGERRCFYVSQQLGKGGRANARQGQSIWLTRHLQSIWVSKSWQEGAPTAEGGEECGMGLQSDAGRRMKWAAISIGVMSSVPFSLQCPATALQFGGEPPPLPRRTQPPTCATGKAVLRTESRLCTAAATSPCWTDHLPPTILPGSNRCAITVAWQMASRAAPTC